MSSDLSEIRVYQAARDLGNEVWAVVLQWKWFPKQTIGRQLVRSVDSIAANIAEGFGRFHYADHRRFIYISRGSAREAQHWLESARDRGLLDEERATKLIAAVSSIVRMLSRYAASIGKPRLDP